MKNLDSIKLVDYTKGEEIANSVSHIIGAVLALIATFMCVKKSIILGRTDYLGIGLVYCLSMLVVFTCSSIYHALPRGNVKKVMRIVDYTAIYLMLIGTITPYMLLSVAKINYNLGWALFLICLAATVISVVLTIIAFANTKAIRMVLYVVIGACAFSSIFAVGGKVDPVAVRYVLLGNGAYIVGLVLFAIGSKKKYFHSLFHIFVMLGAAIHFVNLYIYAFV